MKLLIVDDQISVAEGIKKGINWSALGFTIVDTAYNSFDAKRSLRNQVADVMLCDIEMPIEDGLSLLSWVKEQKMDTRCIFLSAHAKFAYAQEAVRLGGFDYITQPAPFSEISNAVVKAIADIKQDVKQTKLVHMGEVFEKQKPIITSNLLRNFLYESGEVKDLEMMQSMGLFPIMAKPAYLVLVRILKWEESVTPWENSLLLFFFDNIVKELFQPHAEMAVLTWMEEGRIAIVLQNQEGEEMTREAVERQLYFLKSAILEYIKCNIACYMDGPSPVNTLSNCWKKLSKIDADNVSLQSGVYSEGNKDKVPQTFRVHQIRTWSGLLRDGYAEAMEKEAYELLDKLKEEDKLDASTLRIFYQDFVQMVFSTANQIENKDMKLFQKSDEMEIYRNAMISIDAMKTLISYVASQFSNYEGIDDQKAMVEKVKRYISENLENELRRDELAEYVHLNADYLTRIFKKETGMAIKEYVIRQKMEEAQNMIKNTTLPISFIAAKVGYCNFSHFSFTYKKIFGLTPQEER